MVRFDDLRIQQLKAELELRGLPTNGNKLELQARLREAVEAEGLDVDAHNFHVSDASTKLEKAEAASTSVNVNFDDLLMAIQSQLAENTKQMAETSKEMVISMIKI